jgi:hypothetical protein
MDPRLEIQSTGSEHGLSTPFDAQAYRSFVNECEAFEKRMVRVVEESGVLKGITVAGLRAVGVSTTLAPNALEVLRYAQAQTWSPAKCHVHIVSVNWSSEFIRAALNMVERTPAVEGTHMGPIALQCNDLQMALEEEEGQQVLRCTGALVHRLVGPVEKQRFVESVMRDLRDGLNRSNSAESGDEEVQSIRVRTELRIGSHKGVCVFIGDSANDLAAMLAADVGVVLGANKVRPDLTRLSLK